MPAFAIMPMLGATTTVTLPPILYGLGNHLYGLASNYSSASNIDATVSNVADIITTQPKPHTIAGSNTVASTINVLSEAGKSKSCRKIFLKNSNIPVTACDSVVQKVTDIATSPLTAAQATADATYSAFNARSNFITKIPEVASNATCSAFDATGNFITSIPEVSSSATCPAPAAVETYADWILNNPVYTGLGVVGCVAAIGLIAYAYTRSNVKNTPKVEPVTLEPVTDTPSNKTQLALVEQLERFEKSLIKLHDYEVSPSTKSALEKHVLAIDAFKVELSNNKKIDKSHFITGQDLLQAALETMSKTNFETRGGVEKEKGTMFAGYAYLVACARTAFNLFTQLFVQIGLVSHQDAANPVAKALLGQSFFFQVSPTQKENAVIKAQQDTLTQVTDEVEELKAATIG